MYHGICYEHFDLEGLQLLCCGGLITKLDLFDLCMHFLVNKADRRYMLFMWEGKKYSRIYRSIDASTCPYRKFYGILGKLNSLRVDESYTSSHYSTSCGHQLVRSVYKNLIHLNSQVIEEMPSWYDEMHRWLCKVIISAKCQMVVTTDASSLS